MKGNRQLSRSSSLFGADPQMLLRTTLLNNDFVTFKKLVSYGAVDFEYVYPHPDNKTCLELAASELDRQNFVKLLLQHKVQVNNVNQTHSAAPIHFAVRNGNIDALSALLEDDRIDVNIKSKGNTALLMAIEKIEELVDDRDRDLAIYEDMIELLLKAGCNADSPDSKGVTPVYLAAKQGLERVITLILDYSKVPVYLDTYKDSWMKTARDYMNEAFPHLISRFDSSAVEEVPIEKDVLSLTSALLYAGRNGDSETVLDLLRNGACVGLRNSFNEPLLANINAQTLETYLDECITTNGARPSDDNYEIRMKFSLLVYPDNECKKPHSASSNNNDIYFNINENECDAILAPETDALLYMTQNEELRPLLKHPVITSFLYLKWQRISYLFYANIFFYFFLWLCLLLFIISEDGVEKKQANSAEVVNVITHVGAVIGVFLLICRELFQLLVSPTRYLHSIENWMEIILIILSILIISNSAKESTKQQISAIAILLSSAELVLLASKNPSLSTNIEMLKTVSLNFFKFLLWYCILIIAFASSFYTLFRQAEGDKKLPNPNMTGQEEENEDFFKDPGRSIFKTIVMMTGEFDSGSIKFSTFPVTSHIIFIIFVFMVPIILFNLLNGLAVGDTQEIRADAELFGYITQVKLIAYFERVLMGDTRAYSKPYQFLGCIWLNCECLNFIKPNFFRIKALAKQISLFPHFFPEYRIIVKPNQRNRIEISHAESTGKFSDIESVGCCLMSFMSTFHKDKLERIVKNAKLVIAKKNNLSEFGEIKDQLSKYESKIDKLEFTLNKVLQSLEASQKK